MLTDFKALGIALPSQAQGLPRQQINLAFAASSVTQQAGIRRHPSKGIAGGAPGVSQR
jgi:hypothetical protein